MHKLLGAAIVAAALGAVALGPGPGRSRSRGSPTWRKGQSTRTCPGPLRRWTLMRPSIIVRVGGSSVWARSGPEA
jgi:hypothetical protein